jgi:excisionase family DNA binding protein
MSDDEQLLTVPQVAKRAHVGETAVRQWAKDGTLPAVRLGPRTIRFRPADVAELLAPKGAA